MRAPASSESLVDMGVAGRIAARLASGGPFEASYLLEGVGDDLAALVAEAEPLVAAETGFVAPGPASCRVLTRHEWAAANLESLVDVISPLLRRAEERIDSGPAADLVRLGYRPLIGAQLGTVLGLVSHRVLGQYDVLMGESDEVWFVGVNIVLMERRLGFVPRDFRLWVALHEVTHRAQFRGNPWLRGYFLDLVHNFFESIELDPRSFLNRMAQALRSPDGQPAVAMLGPDQRDKFDRIQAFMSVIEGHGNFVMDRVARDRIATHARMKRTMQGRAGLAGPLGRLLSKILGLDLKRLQYEQGQRFFEFVHEREGPDAVRACFTPEGLPTLTEVREPEAWLLRRSA